MKNELNATDSDIPSFKAAVANKNMLERKAGFVCQSSAGRVVRLLASSSISHCVTALPPVFQRLIFLA